MNKPMAVVIAALVVAGGVWWYGSRANRPSTINAPSASPPPASPGVADTHSAPIAPDAHAGHVTRMANAGERRRQLAAQIAAASARRAAQATTPDSTAGSATASAMDSPGHVLGQLMGTLEEVRGYVAACVDQTGAAVPGFKAELTLTGDLDIGTLIDASSLAGLQGQRLAASLDDCIRDVLQTLELPPMAIGDAFKVSYEFTFDDAPTAPTDPTAPQRLAAPPRLPTPPRTPQRAAAPQRAT